MPVNGYKLRNLVLLIYLKYQRVETTNKFQESLAHYLLSLMNKLRKKDKWINGGQDKWSQVYYWPMRGKMLGIVNFG